MTGFEDFNPKTPLILAILLLFFSLFFFYLLLRRLISDHYLRSCGYVTCSRPQRTATGGLEPGTSWPKVLGFTTAPVRSTAYSLNFMLK